MLLHQHLLWLYTAKENWSRQEASKQTVVVTLCSRHKFEMTPESASVNKCRIITLQAIWQERLSLVNNSSITLTSFIH